MSEWAAALFRALADAGVTDVVLSPGSRSTPFVLGALAEPRLHCRDVVDERAAAFFAVGRAKVTGVPTVLLCTSGTAGAHYFPAIIEASRAGVPLIVLTADRPNELQHCDAPQTVDQVKLFGDHVRWFVDLGASEASEDARRWMVRMAARAVAVTGWPTPGPVHLNVRARKPLEPPEHEGPDDVALRPRAHALTRAAVFVPSSGPNPAGLEALAHACLGTTRGLIVCGPGPLSQADARADLDAFAQATGYPLLAEASSQFRFCEMSAARCDAFDAVCRSARFGAAVAPDLVIQIGAAPTSASWEAMPAPAARFVLSPHGWADPQSTATAWILGDVGQALRGATQRLLARRPAPEPTQWRQSWMDADAAARRAVDGTFSAPGLTEGAAVRAVVDSLPRGSLLALGNSLPIREVDTFAAAASADCLVWSQRGANGIDGLVSGGAGAASAGRPTTLLLGDVSFLHDVGGLAVAACVEVPFAIVVLNNGGGRIFEHLPVGASSAAVDRMGHWVTPHDRPLAAAGALFGVPSSRVETLAALESSLAEAHARRGTSLIEVIVPPTSSLAAYRAIDAQLAGASP
jgi:2-succinyl-5-enolpyruvyl-6-hydroxy-3-cyclohexene-1-carboxylate synthase